MASRLSQRFIWIGRSRLSHLLVCLLFALVANAQAPAPAPTPTPTVMVQSGQTPWWKNAVIYEIYPRSYQDSNGDGTGDLKGIWLHLDYLQKLGVDAIWIAPMYPSPQVDFGYDISDYESVDPQYGTLKDFDHLVIDAGRHHIRIILDMVLNHTSDRHKWFLDASKSRSSPMHDWYDWSDGKPGTGPTAHEGLHGSVVPPNNWISQFGGSAWEWVPAVQQFYYHKFYRQQPDLNWHNPAVEKAMFNTMQFWLDRGVAGFRLDAITNIFEDTHLRDERVLGGTNAQGDPRLSEERTNNLPEVHDLIRRMRSMVASYPGDRVLIGETYLPNTAQLYQWYGGDRMDELQLPMDMLVGFSNKLQAPIFRKLIQEAETQVGGAEPLFVFDNHDNPRSIDRYGDGLHDQQISKLLGAILLTTRCTTLLYQGEELGMTTSTPTRREDVKDPIGITGWPKDKGRDGERTPMQWNTSNPAAGFSTAQRTWLPVASNYITINVVSETKDPGSQLNWYRRLIGLRRDIPVLQVGRTVMLDTDNPSVLSYARITQGGKGTVITSLNMSRDSQLVSLDLSALGVQGERVETLITDAPSLQGVSDMKHILLPPFAAWIGIVK
jgi:alpha-glucosidase